MEKLDKYNRAGCTLHASSDPVALLFVGSFRELDLKRELLSGKPEQVKLDVVTSASCVETSQIGTSGRQQAGCSPEL